MSNDKPSYESIGTKVGQRLSLTSFYISYSSFASSGRPFNSADGLHVAPQFGQQGISLFIGIRVGFIRLAVLITSTRVCNII
jgi:hypothetical protein